MTHIFKPLLHEAGQWRAQASKAAAHLKSVALDRDEITMAFAFDDGVVSVTISAKQIREMPEKDLAELLYETALTAAQTGGSA